ncbi:MULTISPECIES: polymorphic toxin-type HINT domain-containing protein [Streptomyces violaceusniger group]|nr:polymorphic toxin-type HINT domain-containing protein [Streptomyces rhizosphaericus]
MDFFGPDTSEWKKCGDFKLSGCLWAAADLPGPGKALKGVKIWKKARKAEKKADDAVDAAEKAVEKCHSFTEETQVELADGGHSDIKKIKVGDKVLATDPETGKSEARPVVATIVTNDDKDFTDLTVKTGDRPASIIATDTHPFWVTSEARWVDAGDVITGMQLRTDKGKTVTVTSVRHFTKPQRTYDLTVSRIHTYYVLAGATPVLVHNSGPNCGVPLGGKNGDHLGGEDFHGSEYSLDEITEFVNGHTGDGNPTMGRPSAAEVETTLRQAGPRQLEGQNSSRFDHNGVRVIVNWDMPWKSTAYYPGR